ncbi:MAG TPA: hypothetical protein VFM53_10150 [Anaeromyxobacteraceae bacterium]|nr:hypothetical protein [Anaeromyxobacteraceae bacterium]
MRTSGPSRLLLLAPALLAAACSSNPAVEPALTVGGWSWDPAAAGDHPLPVVWGADGAPQRLPLPPPGDCPSSGSVMALAANGGKPIAGGIAARCDAGQPTFLPVAWPDATTVQPLQLAPRTTQGTVMAMAVFDGKIYAAGAVGFLSPQPAVWVDGVLRTIEPLAFIPPGHDAALITSIVPSTNFVVATGIAHVAGSAPPAFTGVGWVFDTELRNFTYDALPMPEGVDAEVGPALYLALAENDTTVATATVLSPSGAGKAVLWDDTTSFAPFGLDFTAGPFASPTSVVLVAGTPYSSGLVRQQTATSRPLPAIWAFTTMDVLSTVDATTALGAGEALAIFNGLAFVAGESCQPHPTDASMVTCPAAYWRNGSRFDLGPLAPAGGPVEVTAPLFGWWRVPGTPSTAPPDWPFPGGLPEILGSARMGAAGSAVGRSVVAIPPP